MTTDDFKICLNRPVYIIARWGVAFPLRYKCCVRLLPNFF
jgi:hypothetical protein